MEKKKPKTLRKELSYFYLIGIAGIGGTGILFNTARMAAFAGPAAVISWFLGGLFISLLL